MRKLLVMLTLIGTLTLTACGGAKSDSSAEFDKVDTNDRVAFQKAYCKENGWKYEAATNTCKR